MWRDPRCSYSRRWQWGPSRGYAPQGDAWCRQRLMYESAMLCLLRFCRGKKYQHCQIFGDFDETVLDMSFHEQD